LGTQSRREIDLIRVKSGLEMLALTLNSLKADEAAAARELSKIFGGLDFEQVTMYAQMDVWHAITRGLPRSAGTLDAFLLFLEQLIAYMRGEREAMPDIIAADAETAAMFVTREQVIRIDVGDMPTRYSVKGGVEANGPG